MIRSPRAHLDLIPLADYIGAEIRGLNMRNNIDDETLKALYQAWLDYVVLVFRGQNLTQEDLLRVGTYFGEVHYKRRHQREYHAPSFGQILPGIRLISNIREHGEPIGSLPDGPVMFHHDMTHKETPNKATLLFSVEVPSRGGNTLFASGYAAYDKLAPEIRTQLRGKFALHRYNYGSTQRGDGRGESAFSEWVHPVFRDHEETGRKALYINRLKTVKIVNMPPDESETILDILFDHAEMPQFVYSHEWRKGDIVLWDNRCCSHARTDFPSGEARLMLRIAIEGTERLS